MGQKATIQRMEASRKDWYVELNIQVQLKKILSFVQNNSQQVKSISLLSD